MKRLAPAKINLSLRVLGRREDGFHDIETLIAPISLADEVIVEPSRAGAGLSLDCDDSSLPTGPENLAWKTAQTFCAHVRRPPDFHLELHKKIPHGAGLGGGSSDAAAVLLALNDLTASALPRAALLDLASSLGSDVPFFLDGGAALCRGRGEQISPVAFARLPLLLLKPPFGVPTPWAYQRWRDSREIPGAFYQPQKFAWGTLVNDLERPVFAKYLLLADLKSWLLGQPGVLGALMSGSGSTVFAVLESANVADALAAGAREQFGELWTCPCFTVGS